MLTNSTCSKLLLQCSFLLFISATSIAQTGSTCTSADSLHISKFVSVIPSAQPDSLRIPSSHTFQMLVQQGEPYSNILDGTVKSSFDFTGYVPINNSSINGYLSINHEVGTWPSSGVSILSLFFDETAKKWSVTNKVPVDFSTIKGTGRNCSGTVTPWNTVVTCEETLLPDVDANLDGYMDIGWSVEIDPATHTIVDYDGDGKVDKLWKLGRMSHENIVVAADRKTVYEGNDEKPGYIFKFIADTPEKLNAGKLYVLKLDSTDLTIATNGSWIEVPTSTPTECNNVRSFATSVAATDFVQIEDVEISPKDGMVYFTSKNSGRVYRFKDNGDSTSNFSIFVGNKVSMYNINYGTGTALEQWETGNDNLTFDNEGNLYVLQDGKRNHIWMVRPCHTTANPSVELFAVTPAGSEPTGMTFSPDSKFMFVSFQHPAPTNITQMKDAAGNMVTFNKESAIVIARKEFLGQDVPLPVKFLSFRAAQNGFATVKLEWKFGEATADTKFFVEKMNAQNQFEVIGSFKANTNAGTNYTFEDKNATNGNNYYRIKTVDANGNETFTEIKLISISQNNLQIIQCRPNPVSDHVNLMLSAPATAKGSVNIYTADGVRRLNQNIQLNKGNNNLKISAQMLTPGIYFVEVSINGQAAKTRFIKQ